METASLDDFMALNEQLAALVEAGVPLDLGLGQPAAPAAKLLERINATVVRRVSRGESLEEALEGDEQDVPASYRSIVQLGLHTGKLSAALEGSNHVAETVDDSRYALETAFIYPLIVCCLAYAGLISFCLFLVPALESMYRELGQAPGTGLRVLQVVRDALPYWATILPAMLLLLIVWRARFRSRRGMVDVRGGGLFNWLPGMSRTLFQERSARFAASLGDLLDKGTSFHEALQIAGDASGDVGLRESAKLLAAQAKEGKFPSDDSPIALRFPPFLRWAIWHADATTGRERALQFAARLYREAAEHRAERLRTMAPVAVLVLLCGSVALLYCLALFVPVVELLRTLATPR